MTEQVQEQERKAENIVTSETLEQFHNEKLGLVSEENENTQQEQSENNEVKNIQSEQVEQETQSEEIPPDGTMEGGKVVFRGKWVPKSDVGYRMHLKTEDAKQARARAEAAEAKLREFEAKQNGSQEKTDADPKPVAKDFEDAFDYAEKLAEWSARNALKENEKKQREALAKQEEDKRRQGWQDQVNKAQEKYDDFDDVMQNPEYILRNEAWQAISESEFGADIAYYIGTNPEIREKLAKMTVTGALREIGKIEAKFEDGKPAKVATKPTTSKAPPPINPIKGGIAAGSKFDADGNWTGTAAEYREYRQKGGS